MTTFNDLMPGDEFWQLPNEGPTFRKEPLSPQTADHWISLTTPRPFPYGCGGCSPFADLSRHAYTRRLGDRRYLYSYIWNATNLAGGHRVHFCPDSPVYPAGAGKNT